MTRAGLPWREAFDAAQPATEGDALALRVIREASTWSSAQSYPASLSGQRMAVAFTAAASAYVEASSPARREAIAPALIACAAACVTILDQVTDRAANTWRDRSDLV